VTPAPKYAVPNVDALGPVPSSLSELDAYLGKLDAVSRAMQVVQDAYSKALNDRAAMAGRFDQEVSSARGAGVADDPDVAALAQVVAAFLARRPTPTQVVASLVDTYAAAVRTLAAAKEGSGP
jgi:ATP phosphoribosyltransferase regulatory subunit HisZ